MALTSNQWLFIDIASHLVISAQVIDLSWDSELAEMMVVEPIRVLSIQIVIQLTSADLPIPRPEEIALRSVSKSSVFFLICSLMSSSTSRCHLRGPAKFSSGVPACPQGNTSITKLNGLSLIAGAHNCAINSTSSSALNTVDCIFYHQYLCVYHPLLCNCQRPCDGYALVNIDRDSLLGHPTVLMFQDF